MKKHLAIFSKDAVERIFSGQKDVETRFSKHRIPPFSCVEAGDIVYVKVSGGEIVGQFTIKKVLFFDGLDKEDWSLIRSHYQKRISFGDSEKDNLYFKDKETARFGTLIFIDRVEQFITSPIKVRKVDRRGWLVIGG
jgi:predicted transcriptional regulator